MLKSLSENAKKDWRSYLPKLAFAYNSTMHKSTGFSPFFLLFGRQSRLPIDTIFRIDAGEKLKRKSYEQFAKDWKESMREAYLLADTKMKKSGAYNKKYYDKKAKAVEIEEGDKVLVRNVREKGGTGKLKSYWEEAIFTVVEKRGELPVFKIKNEKKIVQITRCL